MFGRIQNIYLLLSLILVGLSMFFDLAILAGDAPIALNLFGATAANTPSFEGAPTMFYYLPIAFWGLSLLFTLAALVKHGAVRVQLKLVYAVFVANFGLVLTIFMGVRNFLAYFGKVDADVQYTVGLFLPVAALALIIMALRGVRKDVELLKSIDRIR
tara:strand:- start:3016 stop:3489 length:474 start_codon:yes stop_codon:yes gene_type:complete